MNYRLVFLTLNLITLSIFANPTGLSPIAGDVALENLDGKTLYIHASDRAIIEWDDFSIAVDEITKFIQPNANAAVLNRVVGNHLSKLLGALQSNGQVYLVNPHGLVFGKDAVIDTNSFIASTLDVLNENFLNGSEIIFRGDSQEALINLGTIRAENGDLILIANRLENDGNLCAPNGSVALGCAREVLIQPEGEDHIYIRTTPSDENPIGTGILNTGNISASNVTLVADGNHYAFAINHEGSIDAFGVREIDGRIRLVAEEGANVVNGPIRALNSDDVGGTIHILGSDIDLSDNAEIHVDGISGGGCVLVGGDYQGENPDIPNANRTYMSKESNIYANAEHDGNGGKVILWSNEITGAYGNIDARGGDISGDGGFVEISGKYLDFRGFADRTAPNGEGGTLLLDPSNISITAADLNTLFGGICGANTFCATGTPATIDVATLSAALIAGNVIITTASAFGEPGDISFLADMIFPGFPGSAFDLTIITDRDFIVRERVENLGFGSFTATVGRDMLISGPGDAVFATRGTTTVIIGRDLTLLGFGGGAAQLGHAGIPGAGSTTNVDVVGNILLDSLSNGGATLIGSPIPGAFTNIISGGNLTMQAGGVGASSQISVGGLADLSMQIGGDLIMIGTTSSAAIIAGGFDYMIDVNGSINMSSPPGLGFANASIFQTNPGGSIQVIAGQNLILNGTSRIESFFGDPITLVVDNNFPTSPQIGPGFFQLDAEAFILSGNPGGTGQVQIFTAVRSQNMIDPLAMINNTTFSPGTLYVDSASEQWLTYFPDPTTNSPFIIFYKDPIFAQALAQAVSSNVEILRFLNPYNEFTDWALRYVNYYDEMGVPNTDHFIRRRHFKDLNVVLPVYNPDL